MLDTAIVAPGDINHLLRFCRGSFSPGGITDACTDKVDPLNGGVHANLYNNLWGTAVRLIVSLCVHFEVCKLTHLKMRDSLQFPQWYDDDGVARFQIHMAHK